MPLTEQAAPMLKWDDEERAAETMVPLVGALYRERAVEISVFGKLMVKRTVNDIIKAHEFTRHLDSATLLPHDTLPMLQAVAALPVRQAHIDIGKLTARHLEQQAPAPLA